jgi:polyhydroxyalkanoate synthesis repressor PhaR
MLRSNKLSGPLALRRRRARATTAVTMLVKKYSNRRLYDTVDSKYITLDELAAKIRGGADPRVVDAKTNADLTQATLAQIILESRGGANLLPVPLLTQLIRMGDDALAEFLGRYVSWSLEIYVQAKQGAQALAPYNPFATVPFSAAGALARMVMGNPWAEGPPPAPPPPPVARSRAEPPPSPPPSAPSPTSNAAEVAQLRRDLEELKRSLHPGRKRR